MDSFAVVETLQGHKSPIYNLALIDDTLVSASHRVLNLWQSNPPYKQLNTLKLGYDTHVIKNYQGRIVTSYKRQDLRIWDINSSKMVEHIVYDSPIIDVVIEQK